MSETETIVMANASEYLNTYIRSDNNTETKNLKYTWTINNSKGAIITKDQVQATVLFPNHTLNKKNTYSRGFMADWKWCIVIKW